MLYNVCGYILYKHMSRLWWVVWCSGGSCRFKRLLRVLGLYSQAWDSGWLPGGVWEVIRWISQLIYIYICDIIDIWASVYKLNRERAVNSCHIGRHQWQSSLPILPSIGWILCMYTQHQSLLLEGRWRTKARHFIGNFNFKLHIMHFGHWGEAKRGKESSMTAKAEATQML